MIVIVGAGMAGLLAANMLHRHEPLVIERAPKLPNNHSAVLRFRSNIVGDVLGIPFKRVQVVKDRIPWRNPVADALAYSYKNTGVSRSDRSITSGLTVADRWIAPPNLIERMADRVDVNYDVDWNGVIGDGDKFISTIPMPALMAKLGYEPTFDMTWRPALNIRARVPNCDAYVSLMFPDPNMEFSRASITGDELIVEVPGATERSRETVETYAQRAAMYLGVDSGGLRDIEAHPSQYAKILPVPEEERREFIYEASVKHNVYSLGRFATWRPGLLMDDLVQDVRKIEGWLAGRSHYNLKKDGR